MVGKNNERHIRMSHGYKLKPDIPRTIQRALFNIRGDYACELILYYDRPAIRVNNVLKIEGQSYPLIVKYDPYSFLFEIEDDAKIMYNMPFKDATAEDRIYEAIEDSLDYIGNVLGVRCYGEG